MEYKDYYKILGVEKGASEKEIKQTYRRLARKYHPDVNPNDKNAQDKFKEINEAHEVLSNPEKRKKYDTLGSNWQQYEQYERSGGAGDPFRAARGGTRAGGAQYRNVSPEEMEQILGQGGGFSDFFRTFFGGADGPGFAPGGARGAPPAPRQDMEESIDVTLEEAFNGAARLLDIDGRRLEVKIPAGVKTGSKVRVPAKALGNGATGDLYLNIHVADNPNFERQGDDLYTKAPVDVFTAVLGGEIRVQTLKGSLMLRIPPMTQGGKQFRLAAKGMPRLNAKSAGDLFVQVSLRLPEHISDEQRELWQKLADHARES